MDYTLNADLNLLQVPYAGATTPSIIAALAGDDNGDDVVDAADYTVWRDHLGAPAGTLPNDTDGGAIGSAQYATWKANFGMSQAMISGRGAEGAVPEPTTARLLSLAVAAVALAGRAFQANSQPDAHFGC